MKKIINHLARDWYKYLLELIVITAGVFGAFALNNWNESRKQEVKEKALLNEVMISLIGSRNELEKVIEHNTDYLGRLEVLLTVRENHLPYTSNLDSSFAGIINWTSPFLKSTAYENLKNIGLDIIKNTTLKEKLISVYEYEFIYTVQDYDRTEWMLAESVTYPYFVKRIRHRGEGRATPTNYEELMSSPEFVNILTRLITIRKHGIRVCTKVIASVDEAIVLLERELDK